MSQKAMDVYLNDHLGGAMFGSALAEQIQSMAEGTPLAAVMAPLVTQVEEDRQTLIGLLDRLGTKQNVVKQAATWVGEKASRAKFTGLSSGEPELGMFMALETLALGVQGKLSLWKALTAVREQYEALVATDLGDLIERAESQYSVLERERVAAGVRALSAGESAPDPRPASPASA